MISLFKKFVPLLILLSLFLACDENQGSVDSRPCSSNQFAPLPDSICPVEGFIGVGARGTNCLCENEFDEKFLVRLGPSIGDPDAISIRMTNYGIMMLDCSTISLFSDVTFNNQVGELQELSSGFEVGSLEFVLFLNADSSTENVVCSQCFTGPIPPGCDLQAELLD